MPTQDAASVLCPPPCLWFASGGRKPSFLLRRRLDREWRRGSNSHLPKKWHRWPASILLVRKIFCTWANHAEYLPPMNRNTTKKHEVGERFPEVVACISFPKLLSQHPTNTTSQAAYLGSQKRFGSLIHESGNGDGCCLFKMKQMKLNKVNHIAPRIWAFSIHYINVVSTGKPRLKL